MKLNWARVAAAFALVFGGIFLYNLANLTVVKAYERGPTLPVGPARAGGEAVYLCIFLIFILGLVRLLTREKS